MFAGGILCSGPGIGRVLDDEWIFLRSAVARAERQANGWNAEDGRRTTDDGENARIERVLGSGAGKEARRTINLLHVLTLTMKQ